MAKHPYLEKSPRLGIWQFRRVVPARLRPMVGKSAVTVSLKSTDLKAVMPRYLEVLKDTETMFARCEAALATGAARVPTKLQVVTEIREIAEAHATSLLQAERDRRAAITRRAVADQPSFWSGEIVALPRDYFKGSMLHPDLRPKTVHAALADIYGRQIRERIDHLNAILIVVDNASLFQRYVTMLPTNATTRDIQAFASAELDMLRSLRDAAAQPQKSGDMTHFGRGVSGNALDRADLPPAAAEPTRDDPLLSHAVLEWLDAHRGKVWDHEYAKLNQTVMDDFIQIVGDKPISAYRRGGGREFRNIYERLPAHLESRRRKLQVATRDLRAIVASAERVGIARQHPKTTNQKIQIVGSCFKWLRAQYDACATNPVDGIKVATSRARASSNEEKDPFTIEQLRAIFSAPIYTGCASQRDWKRTGMVILRDSEKFWLPLLGLYTGARSNELCQLEDSNILDHEGIHYILLHKDMRLKTAASVRCVPLHRILIDAGFLDFVATRRGKGRLFPDIPLSQSGRYSDAFGKHFRRFLDALGIKTERTDFHSFRHNFSAAARASGIDPETRERLIGHVYNGEGSRYGKNFTADSHDMQLLRFRARELDKLQCEGLDLHHLMLG